MTTVAGTTNGPVGIKTFGPGTTSGPTISGAFQQAPITIQGSQVDPSQIQSGAGMQNTSAVLGSSTQVDTATAQAAAAAQQKAAEDAARAQELRGMITSLANTVKSIFDQRYGQADASAREQSGKLDSRFGTESGDIVNQVKGENEHVGAAHAASGTFDSSYRGNNVDTVTHGGEAQIRDLGTELEENRGKIGGWLNSTKAGYDAEKGGMDSVLAHLAEETDPGRLTELRNTLDSRIATLRAGGADNNTTAQNAATLASIAPSSPRVIQLKTTLSSILGGNAPSTSKAAIAQKLISSAQLNPDEQERLLAAFSSDLSATDKQTETAQ